MPLQEENKVNQQDKLIAKNAEKNPTSERPGAPPEFQEPATSASNRPAATTAETGKQSPRTVSQRQLPKKKRLLKKYYREQQKAGQPEQRATG
jgi:hypothetical protein